MILAYHFVFSTYGFWLPNDPRGSGSTYVGLKNLYVQYGPATRVTCDRSVARRDHDRAARLAAKRLLPRAPVRLTGLMAREVARGVAEYAMSSGVLIYACSVLPTHVHLVTSTGRLPAEKLLVQFKGAATHRLRCAGMWAGEEKVWSRGGRHRFIDSVAYLRRAIAYVRDNPLKDGLRRQEWGFVSPVPRALGG